MTFHYIYDENGRLTSVVRPSGKIVELEFDLSDRGAAVSAKDEKSTDIVIVKGSSVTTTAGEFEQPFPVLKRILSEIRP